MLMKLDSKISDLCLQLVIGNRDQHPHLVAILDATCDHFSPLSQLALEQFTCVGSHHHNGPALLLLELQGMDDPMLPLTVELGMQNVGQQILGWMWVDSAIEAASNHMRSVMNAKHRGNVPYFLDAYRPHVSQHLPTILTAKQWCAVHAPAAKWAWIGWDGHLQWAPAPDTTLHRPSHINMSDEQSLRLEECVATNAVLRAWVASDGVLDEMVIQEAGRLVAQCRQRYPQTSYQDRAVYAVYALRHGERFDNHPLIRQRIDMFLAQPHGMAQALGGVSDTQWAMIGYEFQRNTGLNLATEHRRR
ncbi:hypothetical protein CO611_09015 [Lysobacteraceae bacterium NML03-0222]|nr:hypothetical protein CO611_09015 [Xanthomonadaceae bacterium NML03-0222]